MKANYEAPDSSKKQTKLTQDTILSVFRSFFGKIKDTITCFRDLLTFSLTDIWDFFFTYSAIFHILVFIFFLLNQNLTCYCLLVSVFLTEFARSESKWYSFSLIVLTYSEKPSLMKNLEVCFELLRSRQVSGKSFKIIEENWNKILFILMWTFG